MVALVGAGLFNWLINLFSLELSFTWVEVFRSFQAREEELGEKKRELEKLKKSMQVQSYEQLKNLGIAMEKVCMILCLLEYKVVLCLR
jgi:amino acid permease